MSTPQKYVRSDIWLATLDGIESEMRGTRPVLILQNNRGNEYSPNVIVIPISTKAKSMPTHIKLGDKDGVDRESYAMAEHILTLSKSRLKTRLSQAHPDTMRKVDNRILFSCGIELQHPSTYQRS